MALAIFDPKLVIVTYLGSPVLQFADGSMIEIAPIEDTTTMMIGNGGDAVISISPNRGMTIKLTLLASSPSNDDFSAALALLRTGLGIGPFSLEDLTGRTLVTAPNTWISRVPDIKYGKESTPMEWNLMTNDADVFIGGSNAIAAA